MFPHPCCGPGWNLISGILWSIGAGETKWRHQTAGSTFPTHCGTSDVKGGALSPINESFY